jgi:hypothetical protein
VTHQNDDHNEDNDDMAAREQGVVEEEEEGEEQTTTGGRDGMIGHWRRQRFILLHALRYTIDGGHSHCVPEPFWRRLLFPDPPEGAKSLLARE